MLRSGSGECGLVIPNERAGTGRSARKGPSRPGFCRKSRISHVSRLGRSGATVTRLAPHDLRLLRQKRAPRIIDQRLLKYQRPVSIGCEGSLIHSLQDPG